MSHEESTGMMNRRMPLGKDSEPMAMTVETLARLFDAEVRGDATRIITGVQPLDVAGPQEITFLADKGNFHHLRSCKAGAIILGYRDAASLNLDEISASLILVEDAHSAIIEVLDKFRPARPRAQIGISEEAYVSTSAKIGKNTNIYPGAYVGDNVVIGSDSDIYPSVYIGPTCRLGNNVTLHPGVVLYSKVILGNRVTIHASSVLGGDGFGYRRIDGRYQKVPHLGGVRVEDDVEIGSCTTVDRAMISETIVGEGTKLDNQVVIAHNCQLGRHNAFAAHVGLAGSVTTGDHVVLAGQVGIADHTHLGEGCTVGGKSGVTKNIPDGETHFGIPAQPIADATKFLIALRKLPELRSKIRELELRITYLEDKPDTATEKQHTSRPAA